MKQAEIQVQARSSFVTVLAWIFIILAGFATFIAILQNVMISIFFPIDQMQSVMRSGSENDPAAQFMVDHLRLFFAAFLVLPATLCTVSIALLKRKNWARIAFICFLALGIIWNIGSIFLQGSFFLSVAASQLNVPAEFRSEFEFIATVMLVLSAVVAIGISLLFAWLIKRLVSMQIKAEFQH